ncbi:exonuclease domain-containing protein [Anatilimnocola sp. NA78]|uniref:DEAD/DEAH box helicase n=1 Tax=Anatilimnocola sp. NA78 TaxID=3415683 RepID=UPI003CE477E3
MSAFELLARPIQHALWDMGWQNLRPIQVDAIRELLQTDHHLLISARTASGKTEAAFLPILSDLFVNPPESIGAIYVGPLKALINDQFRRLDVLCERAEIPVHRWHGDVDAGKKAKTTSDPRGVLLITPESIESLFVNRSRFLGAMFQGLRFVVIDEIHALVGRERGLQLRSLLSRLRRYTNADVRIVGLSATIGDAFEAYKRWIAPDKPESVAHITDPGEKKRMMFGIQTFLDGPQEVGDNSNPLTDDQEANSIPPALLANILQHFAGQKNLIFCNRREQVEQFADELNSECQRLGRLQEFWVHHGSLSREIREDTELEMRGGRPATAICSSTLELGIDIGNVVSVGQIGPTWSVNSLVQRLGRSGRKDDEPHCMRVMLMEHRASAKSDLVHRLYPSLLQAISTTELMRERWVEPPESASLDLSTLTQQVLSSLTETGGLRAADIFQRLVSEGAFRALESDLFAQVLRALGRSNLIEQAPDKTLILTPDGERVVHDYDFYSAFATGLEFSVRYDGRLIGTLPALLLPKEGDHLLLGGKRWQVDTIDVKRVEILVRPARGKKPPRFLGSGGQVHQRVREKMREVLLAASRYDYLDQTSIELLEEARHNAQTAQLVTKRLLETADNTLLWFTWTGSKTQNTLRWIFESLDVDVTDHSVALEIPLSPQKFVDKLASFLANSFSAQELAEGTKIRELRKFDRFLDDSLLVQSLAADHIDIEGARTLILTALVELESTGFQTSRSENSASERLVHLENDDDYEVEVRDGGQPRLTIPPETLLSNIEFVAFDLETTGLHPIMHKVLEVAAIRFRLDGTEVDRFHSLVNPECEIPEKAIAIHGITSAAVMDAPRLEAVLPGLLSFFAESPTLAFAHNAAFDIGFLAMAMDTYRVERPPHSIFDSLQLARGVMPALANCRLGTVARELGVSTQGSHRALRDAEILKSVLVRLLAKFRTVGDLAEIAPPLHFSDYGYLVSLLPDGFECLATAIEERQSVMMIYTGGIRSESLLMVTPHAVVEFRERQYLRAFCQATEQIRTYRLDRIRSLRIA